jgi:PAS domain-containing protein
MSSDPCLCDEGLAAAILSVASTPILVLDARGVVVRVNEPAVARFGGGQGHLIDQPVTRLWSGPDAATWPDRPGSMAPGVWRGPVTIHRADGTTAPALLSLQPAVGASWYVAALGWIAGSDVEPTEREVNRVLRTELHNLVGGLDLLAETPLEPRQCMYLAVIQIAVNRLVALAGPPPRDGDRSRP